MAAGELAFPEHSKTGSQVVAHFLFSLMRVLFPETARPRPWRAEIRFIHREGPQWQIMRVKCLQIQLCQRMATVGSVLFGKGAVRDRAGAIARELQRTLIQKFPSLAVSEREHPIGFKLLHWKT